MEAERKQGKPVIAMNTAEQLDRKYQENLERIRNFRLMDDDFMTKCFEGDTACAELVLRIVLDKPDLMVTDVRTQVFVENLTDRSLRLDILATDSTGRKYNIEIQRADKGAGRKRARFHASMIDSGALEKKKDFEALPEAYVVFITERDVIGQGRPVYHVERCIMESGECFGDGSHILYVNGAYRDETPIGKLMHDFDCKDPAQMHYGVLADRVRFFKESKEGTATMCKMIEDILNKEHEEALQQGIQQGIQQGLIEAAKNMLRNSGLALEKIAECVELPLEEVQRLHAEMSR